MSYLVIVDTHDKFRGQRILLEVDTSGMATQEAINKQIELWKEWLEEATRHNTLRGAR